MESIKEKVVKNLDLVCEIEGLRCPLCSVLIQKVHINAEIAKISDAEIFYNIEDSQKLRGEIDFKKAHFRLFPPYGIGFSCPSCNVNVLIEKNKK